MSEHTCHCRSEDLEDMPMSRYINPIPTCGGQEEHEESPCGCREELEAILEELVRQRELLVDILAAINGLTAAWLAK